MKKNKIVVTGGSGLVGSHLNKILPENYEDMPVPNPEFGCDNPQYYHKFQVIRNSTLFNYINKDYYGPI